MSVHERPADEPRPGGAARAARRDAVRRRLSTAALELFFARGYDATTVEDIVAAGKASRSTFFRYFGTKDDVVLSRLDEIGLDWVRRYRVTLAHDEPGSALARSALAAVHEAAGDPGFAALMLLTVRTPALQSRLLGKIEEWRLRLQAGTAEHLGSDPADLVPVLLTHVVTGAVSAAFFSWLASECAGDLLDLLDHSLALARDGFASIPLSARGDPGPAAPATH